MEFIDRLAKLWDDAGVARNDGASAETIAAFEQGHSVSLPDDVRPFYSRFNGTIEADTAFIVPGVKLFGRQKPRLSDHAQGAGSWI